MPIQCRSTDKSTDRSHPSMLSLPRVRGNLKGVKMTTASCCRGSEAAMAGVGEEWASPYGSGQWLLALAGEAGSGKSTLSRALGRRLRWPVIDKDDVKDLLYGRAPDSGPLAYEVMFNVARRQL